MRDDRVGERVAFFVADEGVQLDEFGGPGDLPAFDRAIEAILNAATVDGAPEAQSRVVSSWS